jgi:GNAT superfamily N-acetyltransferase
MLSEAPIAAVAELSVVPISFTVTAVCDLAPNQRGDGFALSERSLETPYVKNYDAFPGEGPANWPRRFDISNWGFIQARSNNGLVGGAVIAFDTPDVALLEGRLDLAVLWDIRVAPDVRRHGIGSQLLLAAETWAISKGCRELKVETQNINVPACRFYERHGFVLKAVNRAAYPELPSEIQLLWYKNLP